MRCRQHCILVAFLVAAPRLTGSCGPAPNRSIDETEIWRGCRPRCFDDALASGGLADVQPASRDPGRSVQAAGGGFLVGYHNRFCAATDGTGQDNRFPKEIYQL